jgi:hypothetical protein
MRPPYGTRDQFLFLSRNITFTHLRYFWYRTSSLTRGRVCNIFVQVLLGFVSVVTVGSKSRRTWDYILLSHLRLGSLSVACYDSQGYGGIILTSPPHGATCSSEWSGVEFATDGQSASTSWCRAALWGPWPDFIYSLVWHVLPSSCRVPSLTRGQVCILQCTSLTGQSREGPVTIYYCLIWGSPDLEDEVPVFISPGTGWPSSTSRHRVPFSSPLTTRRVTVEVF